MTIVAVPAVLYARYSTDKQRETSIEDQLRALRARAKTEGWTIVATHADEETSGATPVHARPGGAHLLADALAGRFDVLMIESLDRLSRDIGEQDRVVKRLEHRGIRILGLSDGYDTLAKGRKVMRIARGLINEIYLDDLRAKTHRGLTGQVARGFHAGGLSFGYRSVDVGDGHRLEVDQAQAEIVRWIFGQFGTGWSPQRIAADLNRRQVAAPRGGTWAVSALYGNPRKGSGVLNNELYVGRYVWNRSQWLKDPDTGRRQRVDRPREEWQVLERPELAILEPAFWEAARRRMANPRSGMKGRIGPPAKTLFGGLLRCGLCGGSVVAVSQWAYGCAARKDRGISVCRGVRVNRKDLDARLLSHVRRDLTGPEALAALQTDVAELLAESRRERSSSEVSSRGRLAELEREILHLVEAVATFGPSEALKARLRAAEDEQAAIRAARAAEPAVDALPAALAIYRRLLVDLQGALTQDTPRARQLLQDALGEIMVVEEGSEVFAELQNDAGRLMAAGGSILTVVAGTRFGTQNRVRVRIR